MISVPLSAIVGHRGVTHSLLAVAVLVVGLIYLGDGAASPIVAPLVVGYLSHLVGDAITAGGIPALWPWRRQFGMALFRTGGIVELGFIVVVAVGTIFAHV